MLSELGWLLTARGDSDAESDGVGTSPAPTAGGSRAGSPRAASSAGGLASHATAALESSRTSTTGTRKRMAPHPVPHAAAADAIGGAYARRARRLLELVNALRGAGAHMDIDLPTVVVCGNQSVGKSSLIEAVCGIELPRSDGTCTRCVTEVRLAEHPPAPPGAGADAAGAAAAPPPATPWSCTLRLRFEFDGHGRPLPAVREVPFGPPLADRALVPLAVRRAQKALLNPSTDPARFEAHAFGDDGADDARANELAFTRNVVCLDVVGAGVNLALVDLPGIIRSVDRKEDAGSIEMIQDLVRTYIARERTIIVAAITCKDEIENQAIVHLARQADPTGSRTLGVLTKPDTIEPGTADRWVQVLSGRQYPLKLGYFMVRCLSKAEIAAHKTFDDARHIEAAFFDTTQPWAALRRRADRFGVPALRAELSRLLTALAETSLPRIKQLAEEAISAAVDELGQMPPAISQDSRIELLQMIRHFCALTTLSINAQSDFKTFYQRVRVHLEHFRERIAATRPKFALDKKGLSATQPPAGHDGADASAAGPAAARSQMLPQLPRPSEFGLTGLAGAATTSLASSISMVIPRFGGFGFSSPSPSPSASPSRPGSPADSASVPSPPRTAKPPPGQAGELLGRVDTRKPMTLGDLRRIIDSQKGRELQGYSPYSAFTFLVSACQEDWEKHAARCMAAVSKELAALVNELVDKVFGRFSNLQSQLRLFTQMFQAQLQQAAMEQIGHLLAMERRLPFTLNSSTFIERKARFLHALTGQLDGSAGDAGSGGGKPQQGSGPDSLQRAIAALAEAGITGLTPQTLVGKLRATGTGTGAGGIDPAVLDLVASTLSYMDIATSRISDTVPMAIEYHFLERMSESLEKELVSRLNVLESDKRDLDALLEEDWGIAERRAAAEARRARLERVWRSLHEFGV